ncbi:50S ribosomal protein L25/general stress protein Ctc [Galactobacter valiniphilus]|uniref:50S ribosomal protein L25/general stress protein Ctc n=1 Tax=Galactobacter valiniphilus TaxID=2676122 RepID=UPI003736CCB8
MSETQKIAAETRDDFGKGSARQARRDGKIPAVIYGHGADPIHVLLPARETTLAVRTSNAVLDLVVDGEDHIALVKDIQRHPLRQTVDHLDLLTVKKGEKVQVEVNVHVEGEVAAGLVLTVELNTVPVLADALNLPENVVLNVEGAELGTLTADALVLPKGAELELEADAVVAVVSEPAAEEEEEAAEAPAEAEAE